MDKYTYCDDCKRIFIANSSCPFCNSTSTTELNVKSPVNVIGTKVKAKVLDFKPNIIKVLVVDEKKEKSIKEFEASKLRKIL